MPKHKKPAVPEKAGVPAINLMLVAHTASFLTYMADKNADDMGHCCASDKFFLGWYVDCGAIIMMDYGDGMLSVFYTEGDDSPRSLGFAIEAFCERHDIHFMRDVPDEHHQE